jgi:hypothetical protein
MKSYRINFFEHEQADVLRILRQSHDVIIDNIDHTRVGITIEREEADDFYQDLLEKIDHEVYHHKNTNSF